jgi:hypothetical protein
MVVGLNVNLSSEGLIDWANWGNGSFSAYEVKTPLASQISQYTFIGTWQRSSSWNTTGMFTPWSWTNGTPDLTVTGSTSTIRRESALLLGWEITAPASTYEKVFNVYPSLFQCAVHVEAYLSDNSAPVFMDESFNGPNFQTRRYSFRYSSPNAGAILHVRYWGLGNGANGACYVPLSSATLTYGNIMKAVPAAGGQVTVTWPVGTLLTAPAVTGPWTPSGATSPYTFTPTLAQQFFRTQTP